MTTSTESIGVRTVESMLAGRPDLRQVLVLLAQRGKCAGSPTPQAWFVSPRGYFAARARARRLCEGCPVMAQCRAYALEAGEEYGVWGGLCEVDLAQMRSTSTARSRILSARRPSKRAGLDEAG
jgi:hypothetical protein